MKHHSITQATVLRLISAMLILLLVTCSCIGCGRKGKTLMELESAELSINVYQLLLSRMKGTLASTIGPDVLSDSFWDTTVLLDGTTYNDYFTAQVLETAKTYLVALHLFEKYDLTLPEATIAEIDEEMEGLVIGDGDGSKAQLNQILSEYGVSYDILREIYIMEAKANYLQTYLYGAGGSKVADTAKEEFMKENYVRFKQIFRASYYYVFELDAYGNKVYYTQDGKAYMYDEKNGKTMDDAGGVPILDTFGNPIYFDEQGNILYDTVNGFPKYVTDANGNKTTKDYTDTDMELIKKDIELLASQIDEGDYEDFEDLMKDYSEDGTGMDEYENGYYLSTITTYSYEYLDQIAAALSEMKTGETRLIESDYGYHLIMKYDCETGAYSDEDNAIWFTDFSTDLIEFLFLQETEEYKEKITIDRDLLATADMKSVSHNYYY